MRNNAFYDEYFLWDTIIHATSLHYLGISRFNASSVAQARVVFLHL
jgi:hypothetical protein